MCGQDSSVGAECHGIAHPNALSDHVAKCSRKTFLDAGRQLSRLLFAVSQEQFRTFASGAVAFLFWQAVSAGHLSARSQLRPLLCVMSLHGHSFLLSQVPRLTETPATKPPTVAMTLVCMQATGTSAAVIRQHTMPPAAPVIQSSPVAVLGDTHGRRNEPHGCVCSRLLPRDI